MVPNNVLFSHSKINFTPYVANQEMASRYAHPAYSLDEMVVRITYDTDWLEAEKIMLDAAKDIIKEMIMVTGREPYIRSDV